MFGFIPPWHYASTAICVRRDRTECCLHRPLRWYQRSVLPNTPLCLLSHTPQHNATLFDLLCPRKITYIHIHINSRHVGNFLKNMKEEFMMIYLSVDISILADEKLCHVEVTAIYGPVQRSSTLAICDLEKKYSMT